MDESAQGLLVSLEGISGVGKSYCISKLQASLRDLAPSCVKEVMDRQGDGLDRRIIRLLTDSEDRFFRMGAPITETFLLLSLKMYDYEALIAPILAQGGIVIEDRSLDTIAIYQSLLLYPAEQDCWLLSANTLYDQASRWRRPPDLTFLLEDDFDMALSRAAQRAKRPFNRDEVGVLEHAAMLYDTYAACHQPRIVRLDRRVLSEEELVSIICQQIRARHRNGSAVCEE